MKDSTPSNNLAGVFFEQKSAKQWSITPLLFLLLVLFWHKKALISNNLNPTFIYCKCTIIPTTPKSGVSIFKNF